MDVGKGRMDRFRGEGLHARTPARTARPTRTGPSHPTPQPTPPPGFFALSEVLRRLQILQYARKQGGARAGAGAAAGRPAGK